MLDLFSFGKFKPFLICLFASILVISGCGGGTDIGTGIESGITETKNAQASASPVSVVSLEKVSETRLGRTTYEYKFSVTLKNNGTVNLSDIVATVSAAPSGVEVISGKVTSNFLAGGQSAVASGNLIIRLDRTVAFATSSLVWEYSSVAATPPTDLGILNPAELYTFALSDLGITDDTGTATPSGAVTSALIKQGTLRFFTSGDSGAEQQASIVVKTATSTVTLALKIGSTRPNEVITNADADENGDVVTTSKLTISGFTANNAFTGNPVVFKLASGEVFDLAKDSDGVISSPTGFALGLKNFWKFNAQDGSFSISGTALTQLRQLLPIGSLNASINFVSLDGTFAHTYEFLIDNSSAKIAGRIVDAQGNAVSTLNGSSILLAGFNQNFRRVALVNSNGEFSFAGVLPDTYQISLADLENPNSLSVSTLVFPNSTSVSVNLVYKGNEVVSMAKSSTSSSNASYTAGQVVQNGTPLPERSIPRALSPAAPIASLAATATQNFVATAQQQNQTVSTPISYEVPIGTQFVSVKVEVFTQEYPTYTTAPNNPYNDAWSYSVNGLPATVLSATGSVNQSHYTQALTTKTTCVNVAEQTKNNSLKITGSVSATNIGDSSLPTTTTVTFTIPCAGLQVGAAKFLSPNSGGKLVLQPIKPNNRPGPYLTIPRQMTDTPQSLPLEFQFSPAGAVLTEILVGVYGVGQQPTYGATNFLSQAVVVGPGKLRIPSLTMPVLSGARISGRVGAVIRIRGTVEGQPAVSDPSQGGQINFEGATAFVPLYLGKDEAALSIRRYGTRDAGGDSWATSQTINWLLGNSFRFDDISASHVAQNSDGKSILGHKGHSDGQMIDLRYADGNGGYSDTLGGAGSGSGIKTMINAAKAEVASNAAAKPNLTKLLAWITANRAMLTTQAAATTTRKILIGPDFIKRALIDGKFTMAPNDDIPGAGSWEKPLLVSVDDASHLSHWHIALYTMP